LKDKHHSFTDIEDDSNAGSFKHAKGVAGGYSDKFDPNMGALS